MSLDEARQRAPTERRGQRRSSAESAERCAKRASSSVTSCSRWLRSTPASRSSTASRRASTGPSRCTSASPSGVRRPDRGDGLLRPAHGPDGRRGARQGRAVLDPAVPEGSCRARAGRKRSRSRPGQPDNKEGGTGTRAKGEEGSMGNPTTKAVNKRYAVQGPKDNPDPHIARQAALREARNSA